MPLFQNNARYHLLALLATVIWGTTFVSTKILLSHGLTPAEIMFLRFLLAYIAIWSISPARLFAENLRDEAKLIAAGMCGGSLYFFAENSALEITQASNVAIIISITPLLTAILSHLFVRGERFGSRLLAGGLLSLIGIACVVLNGRFVLHISPLGDLLTLFAGFMWACYNIILTKLYARYDTVFITRKVFFYGLVTLLPVFLIQPIEFHFRQLLDPTIALNLLFLGLLASFGCFLIWNIAVRHIGTIRANSYLYLSPLITFTTAAIFLQEEITPVALAGTALILSGVWISEQGLPKPKRHPFHK